MTVLTPESRYASTRPRQEAYHHVSCHADNPTTALAAQWASDICALEEHLWVTAIIPSPSHDAEFHKINQFVAGALTAYSGREAAATAYETLLAARAAVAEVFADDTTLERWSDRCLPADHLQGQDAPTADDWDEISTQHTAGLDPATVLDQRRAEVERLAADLMSDRPVFGDEAGFERIWKHDWTAFHAHLLASSINAGDVRLAAVDLRWKAATVAVESIAGLPASPHDAADQWRHVMADVLGPVEGQAFLGRLLPV